VQSGCNGVENGPRLSAGVVLYRLATSGHGTDGSTLKNAMHSAGLYHERDKTVTQTAFGTG